MNNYQLNYEEVDFLIRLLEFHRDGLSCSYDLSTQSWPSEAFANEYADTNGLLTKLSNRSKELLDASH